MPRRHAPFRSGSLLRPLVAAALLAAVAGCGGASQATTSLTLSPASSASGSPGPSTTSNPAAAMALTASEVNGAVSGVSFRETTDGRVGGQPDTDARVFQGSNGMLVEVDLLIDIGSSAATRDFPAISGHAVSNTVATVAATSTPTIGDQATESTGTTSTGAPAVVVVFRTNEVLVAVTAVGKPGSTLKPATVEAIAQAEDRNIRS